MSYKRKRALLACDFCRHRKRRCDGNRPCATCQESDADCIYQDLPSERLEPVGSAVVAERLSRIESLLQDHAQRISTVERGASSHGPSTTSGQRHSIRDMQSAPSPSSPRSLSTRSQSSILGSDLQLEQTHFLIPEQHSTSTNWLLTLPRVRALLGDYPVDYFYEVEINNPLPPGLDLMPNSTDTLPLLSRDTLDTLVFHYFERVHPNYPIFSQQSFAVWHEKLLRDGITNSIETCICLCVYALGCLSNDQSNNYETSTARDSLGLSFFQPALQAIMPHSAWSFKPDIRISQALVLAASYFAFLGRPLHSWRAVHSSSTNLQQLLSRRARATESATEKEQELRALWSCFMIECDRAAELEVPRSGVEVLADNFPLPSSMASEDSETLFFAAEISIRRLLNRIHNSLYSQRQQSENRASGAHEQRNGTTGESNISLNTLLSVSSELNRQLEEWYISIPSSFRPPLGLEPIENDRQKILRIRYYAAKHIIHRPFLLYAANQFSAETPIPPIILDKCDTCVTSCRTYLVNAGEMLQKRSPYLWTFSQSSLGALLVLSVANSSPQLRQLVYDLADLQQFVITTLNRWSTPGSSFESAVWIIEQIRSKERFLFSTHTHKPRA